MNFSLCAFENIAGLCSASHCLDPNQEYSQWNKQITIGKGYH